MVVVVKSVVVVVECVAMVVVNVAVAVVVIAAGVVAMAAVAVIAAEVVKDFAPFALKVISIATGGMTVGNTDLRFVDRFFSFCRWLFY